MGAVQFKSAPMQNHQLRFDEPEIKFDASMDHLRLRNRAKGYTFLFFFSFFFLFFFFFAFIPLFVLRFTTSSNAVPA